MNQAAQYWRGNGALFCSVLATLLLFAVVGCSRAPVVLMPTPEVVRDERFDPFASNKYLESANRITTFYATNREPAKPGDPKTYSKNRGDSLIFGQVTLEIGEGDELWRSIYSESATVEKKDQVALSLVETTKEFEIGLDSPPDPPLSPDGTRFFSNLNAALDGSESKILTVFAHGANNSFYESVARGAQLEYFTGGNDVAITFAWPSAGSIWGYGHDMRYAEKSIEDFADFMKLLARHSTAKHINVIAYSAGGRIVGGALKLLGEEFTEAVVQSARGDGPRRLNQVYMAASDEPLLRFVENFPDYSHLVDTITVTINPEDNVLGLASIVGGGVRVGAAGEGSQLDKMTEQEKRELRDLINAGKLDIIDMQIEDIEGFEYSHEFWYANPWVSSDVLVTLYVGMDAVDRGLGSYQADEDVKVWYFANDTLGELKESLIRIFGEFPRE
jgi:esterase/lipase superfamily enzyme